jgi:hypothetical protein
MPDQASRVWGEPERCLTRQVVSPYTAARLPVYGRSSHRIRPLVSPYTAARLPVYGRSSPRIRPLVSPYTAARLPVYCIRPLVSPYTAARLPVYDGGSSPRIRRPLVSPYTAARLPVYGRSSPRIRPLVGVDDRMPACTHERMATCPKGEGGAEGVAILRVMTPHQPVV